MLLTVGFELGVNSQAVSARRQRLDNQREKNKKPTLAYQGGP
jgi:hypothetical protein